MPDEILTLKYSQILMENAKLGKSLPGEDYPVHLLSNITVHQLKDILEFTLRRQGIKAVVSTGDYDNILQDAAKFTDTRALIVFWEAANIIDGLSAKFDTLSEETRGELFAKVKAELNYFFKTVADRPLVIMNYFCAQAFTHNSPEEGPFDTFCDELNRFLTAEVPANTVLIDINKIIARLALSRAVDFRYYYSSKALYTIDFFKHYSRTVAPYLLAPLGKSKKAVILDCDNTLWKGIIGEDGADGIDMSAESPEGAIYREVQMLLLQLQARGILLGLCSKNDPHEVDRVLSGHPDMLIRDQHLSIKKVNWRDKASNLREIAQELNIGMDSIVFVDDSDFEVNLVREQLPQITTVQVPPVLAHYPETVRGIMPMFVSLSSSSEDTKRAQMYSEEHQRRQERQGYADLDDYLKSLELKMTIFTDAEEHVPRIAQLTQKTNQFNLTTQRYTEPAIRNFTRSDDSAVYAFRLEDKFGDYGLTGVAILTFDRQGNSAHLDTLLMSCRVIGRNVELAFIDRIMEDLSDRGVATLTASYKRTAKNSQVSDLFDRLGFTEQHAPGGETKSYQIAVGDYKAHGIPYIDIQAGVT